MAQYGTVPDYNDRRHSFLIKAAAVAGGLFALGGAMRPWAARTLEKDLVSAMKIHKDLLGEHGSHFLSYLANKGIGPEVTRLQALKIGLARSPLMDLWEKASGVFGPIKLADQLAFIEHTRETYGWMRHPITGEYIKDVAGKRVGVPQARYLGPAKDLSLFKLKEGGLPAGVTDKSTAYFAYNRLFVSTGGKMQQVEGKWRLYGRAGAGEGKSVIERGISDLTGASLNPQILAQRIASTEVAYARQLGLGGEKLEGGQKGATDVSGWLAQSPRTVAKQFGIKGKDRGRLYALHDEWHRLSRTQARLAGSGNLDRFSRFADIRLNELGDNIFSGTYWRNLIDRRIFGFLEPANQIITRNLDAGRPYDVIHAFQWNIQSLKDMFFGGRNGRINAGTVGLWHLFSRVTTADIAGNGIFGWAALSANSTVFKIPGTQHILTGPAAYIANVGVKRLLPAYAGAFYAGYLNDVLGQRTGERPTDRMRDTRGKIDLAWARYKDRHGITAHVRHLNELSGGFLGYLAHPFVETPVGLSADELADFQKHGEVPVRKGRWWWFGSSTPFRGERIQYYTPYYSRWAKAGDVYNTPTLWGSIEEHYANAALPTPGHPLAFIKHFATDKYHWEKKHYADRPYPLTSPLFEPTSFHGAILNPLLGWLLKPVHAMHQDEMPFLVAGPHRGERNPRYRGDIRSLNEQVKALAASRELTGFVTPSGSIEAMAAVGIPGSGRLTSPISDDQTSDYDVDFVDGGDNQVYIGSGQMSNKRLKGRRRSRASVKELNEKIKAASRFTKGRILEPALPPGIFGSQDLNSARSRARLISSHDLRYQSALGYYSLTEIGGIYGFGVVSVTGDQYANLPTLANAGLMTSFERTFWDRWSLGGMFPTPGLSEAFRRFIPHRFHSNTMYNPIRNKMPSWLPGSGGPEPGYFVDFLHGDPYAAIPGGETRLPGYSYEKLHGIGSLDLDLVSNQVGYDRSMIYAFLTGAHEPFAAYSEEIASRGGAIHESVIQSLRHAGILLQTHVAYDDQKNHVRGQVDALIGDEKNPTAVQIHTISGREYANLGEHGQARYQSELNWDLAELGVKSGQAIYVNRDDPSQQRTINQQFDPAMYARTLSNIQGARQQITREYQQGQWPVGQFYNDITKLSILADVAPWSQQYKTYRDYLVHLDTDQLSPEDRARIIDIKHHVTQRKHRFNMSPYKTKYAGLEFQNVHVKDIIDAQTFTTYEYPDNPIRMAGIHVPSENAAEVADWIHHGSRLKVGYAADETQRVSHDTLHTIRATVYSGNEMVNRALIANGIAVSRPENTPAGMHVRYSDKEFRQAGLMEWWGHAPIPWIHNKFMPMDSPLDLYKRTQVYGKDWQDWRHPLSDYLFPSYEAFAQQGGFGLIGAGILGYALTSPATAKTRAILTGASMALTFGLSHYRQAHPIPGFRQKERDLDEYFDILKYIKYEGMFEKTASWIKKHQHHDIAALAEKYKREGETRKRRIQVLKQEKRDLIVHGGKAQFHDKILEINREIRALQGYRKELRLTREDVIALQYKNMAETTLYGAEPGGDMRKVLLALNPKEREFFQAFLKAAGPERAEILRVTPENERRFLEAAWRMKPEPRPVLAEYFKTHFLPPADWNGWKAESDLEDYKLVVYKQEGLDMTAHGFWPQDEERVAEERLPNIRPLRATRDNIKANLHSTLAGLGLKDVDIDIQPSMHPQGTTKMYIKSSRQDEINAYQGTF